MSALGGKASQERPGVLVWLWGHIELCFLGQCNRRRGIAFCLRFEGAQKELDGSGPAAWGTQQTLSACCHGGGVCDGGQR
jgi:hypothetical protein